MQHLLREICLAIFIVSALLGVHCEAKDNLDPNDELRIGVTHRPDDCPRKTAHGDRLSMHYTGTLYRNDKKFDSSRDRNMPFDFTLGRGEVIQGWDMGLSNMCVGEKRKLTIPSALGYGARGAGGDIKG